MKFLKKTNGSLTPVTSGTDSTSSSGPQSSSGQSRQNSEAAGVKIPCGSKTEEPPSYTASAGGRSEDPKSRSVPISKQSSSSKLRSNLSNLSLNKETKKKKNVPYTPAPEQQKYIDKLGGGSGGDGSGAAGSVTALSTTTSAAHTQYFDVLPSFQMFQSILKRDDEQFSENLSVQPPEYGDTHNSSPTPPTLSPVTSGASSSSNGSDRPQVTIDGILGSETEETNPQYDYEENYGFGDAEGDDGLQSNNRGYYSRRNISNANATYGHTVLDNIDKLPKLNNSPIDIQIFVTKRVPVPHNQNELETRLKEYSNGDLVNGYIVITNTTDKPINFGLFTVSLEGTIKAIERNHNTNDFQLNHKFSKVLMKKFLKMYDFNASYGYIDVPNSAGIEYQAFTKDKVDGCILGLPDDRTLKPHEKYKKFFTFKFPNKLLDTTCPSNILPHILPPPSLGVDGTSFGGKADNIELNKALGYGFISDRGTPLLTRDYRFDDMSVSYTVEAKFIDRINDSQKDPVSHSDINEPENDKNYVVSRSSQYFLRFVPDLKELIAFYNEELLFGAETFGSVGIDGKLISNIIYTSTWRELNSLNSSIEDEIDARLERQEFSDEDIKNKNLIVDNYQNTTSRHNSIAAKEQYLSELVDEEAKYLEKRMLGTKVSVEIFGKRKKKILSSLVKIGYSKLFVKVPDQPITYASPKLIMKYNKAEEYDHEANDLMPVNSISSNHINELYHREEQHLSSSVDISLVFESLETDMLPPAIASIDCNIVAWSIRSDYPLPCKFEYDFFYESLQNMHHKDQVETTKTNLQQVKDQVANYIHFLKANKTFISKEAYLYLKSIMTLGIKTDTINDFFKPITPVSNPQVFNGNWKQNGQKYTRDIKLPLEVLNKHNVNLIPSFQSCLVGRLYCLQVEVKYKGAGGDKNEFADNIVRVDVPILVG